jgi:cardiolipin synthase
VSFTKKDIESIYRRPFVGGNHVELLWRGRTTFERMFKAVRSAQKCITLQFYHFSNDHTGTELAGILAEKAREGVSVYVLYDHLGSFFTPGSFWSGLKQAGVRVRTSHPFRISSPFRYLYRDHSKVITIDGSTAFTGGLNIADEYRGLSRHRRKRDPWRDTGVIMQGPVAWELFEEFRSAWRLWRGEPVDPFPRIGPAGEGLSALPIFTRSSRGRRRMRRLLYYSINHAREEICLSTAYFVPSRRMLQTLEDAVKRGVRVRLLVPGTSDVLAAQYVGRAFFSRLLKRGIEIHEYKGIMMHAKTYIFDASWSIVGSANLDFRSLRWNDEGNVGILDRGFALKMRELFHLDLEGSKRIIAKEWSQRPWFRKMLEHLFSLMRRRL